MYTVSVPILRTTISVASFHQTPELKKNTKTDILKQFSDGAGSAENSFTITNTTKTSTINQLTKKKIRENKEITAKTVIMSY